LEKDHIRSRPGRGASQGSGRSEAFALQHARVVRLAPEQRQEAVELLAGLIADAAAKRCPRAFGGASIGVTDGAFSGAHGTGATGESPGPARYRGV
jgi:hypothetical protein